MVEARTDGFTPCATCRPVRHLADTERLSDAAARVRALFGGLFGGEAAFGQVGQPREDAAGFEAAGPLLRRHDDELVQYGLVRLAEIPRLRIIGPRAADRRVPVFRKGEWA